MQTPGLICIFVASSELDLRDFSTVDDFTRAHSATFNIVARCHTDHTHFTYVTVGDKHVVAVGANAKKKKKKKKKPHKWCQNRMIMPIKTVIQKLTKVNFYGKLKT
jgi:hypothetical protein